MNDKEFAVIVQEARSIRQVLIRVGLAPAGGNYLTIKRRIASLGLATDHFLGQAHLRGKLNLWHPKRPLAEILVKNSSYMCTKTLKRRLLREGVLERKCSACLRTRWRGQPIPLELEHKNGNRSDNRLCNLTLLCPNCHALTPTYRGRNIGAGGRPRWWNGQTHET
jgi:hypothetical protein